MADTFQYTVTLPQSVKPYLSDPELDTKLLIAVKLYQEGSVSIGKAAEISGIGRYALETYLSNHKIPISNLTLEQVMADVASIKKLRGKLRTMAHGCLPKPGASIVLGHWVFS